MVLYLSPARSWRNSRYDIGIEYWQNPDPASEETTHRCSGDDGEDPCCSASVPSRGFTPDHLSVCLCILRNTTWRLMIFFFLTDTVFWNSSYDALLFVRGLPDIGVCYWLEPGGWDSIRLHSVSRSLSGQILDF